MKPFQDKFHKKENLTIVCIGDSTTSQEWCHPNWIDWLDFVFRQSEEGVGLNRKIVNSGADGQNVNYYLDNFEESIARFKPDVVIMSLGFNHLEMPPSKFEKGTRELIQKIKDINSELILWSTYETPNPKYSGALGDINDIYKTLCSEFDCIYIDIYNEFKKYDLNKLFTFKHAWFTTQWDLKPGDQDFLHCNDVGNQIIAEKILKDVFERDLSFTEDWKNMGNMHPLNLNEYLK